MPFDEIGLTPNPLPHRAEPPRARTVWSVVAAALAVALAIAGLAFFAFVVLFFVAMSQYGSNK